MNLIISTISQGFIWAIMAIGLFITFRILDFPDMTVEGSFPLGAVTAVIMIQHGYSPELALLVAFIFGSLAGFATAFMYTKLHIPSLLAGILTMTALYSVNLRILGKANMSLTKPDNIFNRYGLDKLPVNFNGIILGIIIIFNSMDRYITRTYQYIALFNSMHRHITRLHRYIAFFALHVSIRN